MPTAVVMPKLGMTMQEGTVIEWPVELGARVEKGQVVLIIESEKAEVEVEATDSGYFRHVYVEPDSVVPCGTLLAALTESPDDDFEADAFQASVGGPDPIVRTVGAHVGAEATTPAAAATPSPTPAAAPRSGTTATPAARRLAKQHDLELDDLAGTGPGGRITREDIEALVARREALVAASGGIRLEVPSDGPENATGVLLVPGFGTDASAFARQMPVLAESYRVHGVNPRGVGLSDAPADARYDLAVAAADLAALTDEPAHVVGTSLGAATAVELAIAHPEKVRSLTLIAPLITASSRLFAVIDAWTAQRATLPPEALATALLPWLFSESFLADAGSRKRTARGLAQTVARVPAASLERWAAGLHEWSGTREADLGSITAPTLVVVAGEDLLTPAGEAIAQAIPGASCIVVPDAGHAVMLEAPDTVNAALLEHLAKA